MMSIDEFSAIVDPDEDWVRWAKANHKPINSAWKALPKAYIIKSLEINGFFSDYDLRRFTAYCANSVKRHMENNELENCIDVVSSFSEGKASKDDLAAAHAIAVGIHSPLDADYDANVSFYSRKTRDEKFFRLKLADVVVSATLPNAKKAALETSWLAAVIKQDARDNEFGIYLAREEQAQWLKTNTSPTFEVCK